VRSQAEQRARSHQATRHEATAKCDERKGEEFSNSKMITPSSGARAVWPLRE
jgi:hypothetical protein